MSEQSREDDCTLLRTDLPQVEAGLGTWLDGSSGPELFSEARAELESAATNGGSGLAVCVPMEAESARR
jgi:hypothetical protein